MRASLEVADIFRAAGPAYRMAHAGHLSLHQLKIMSAIEHCRTAALGGHVEACTDCGHWRIAYNSCRNRHCPRCQGAAARSWLEAREADLLPVGYFHVVFTLPAEVTAIAYYNKALVYDLLFKAVADTMLTIAADPKHLGARIGITAVLHTWGSALTHHPHIHMIVPGGGLSRDGTRWISARPAFLLPVRVLGALFRRLFLTRLRALHDDGKLAFFGSLTHLAERRAFLRHLSPVRKKRWVVYAKPPFAGPEAVLAYLARYTHRVAISNRRACSTPARPGRRPLSCVRLNPARALIFCPRRSRAISSTISRAIRITKAGSNISTASGSTASSRLSGRMITAPKHGPWQTFWSFSGKGSRPIPKRASITMRPMRSPPCGG